MDDGARTPLELMKELEALQSQNGGSEVGLGAGELRFPSRSGESIRGVCEVIHVGALEDKTMMMEKQLKSLGSSKQECVRPPESLESLMLTYV